MRTTTKKFTRAQSIDTRSRQFIKGKYKFYASHTKESLTEVYRKIRNMPHNTDNVN